MKNFMMLALVFVLSASLLAGCRGQETESSSTTNPSQSTSSTAPTTQSTAPSTQSTAPSDSTQGSGDGKMMPRGPRMPRY